MRTSWLGMQCLTIRDGDAPYAIEPLSVRKAYERHTKDGKIKIEIHSFSPAEPEIKGQTIDAEIGSRGIAVVDNGAANKYGTAYIAFFVGPAIN
jgi:hypothetical protein